MLEVGILEGEEPADAVYGFCAKHDLPEDFRRQILSTVCQDSKVTCTRQLAQLYTQGVAGSDGKMIGQLRVMEGEEPADVVRSFCESNALDSGMQRQLLAVVELECR